MIRHSWPCLLLLAFLAWGSGDVLAQYESPPVLNAKEILAPEIYKGESHQVSDEVQTIGFLNRYLLETDFGSLEALGNEQLATRINETRATAQLREFSQSQEFTRTLEQTATGAVDQAVNLVLRPGESLANIGSGAGKTVVRARETLRRGLKKSGAEKEQSSLLLGIDSVKRDLANQLGVDPYTTNPILQEELTRVATPVVLANLSVAVGTFAIPGSTVLTAYKGVSRTSNLAEKVKTMSPIDLRKLNRERLEALGVKKKQAVKFLDEAWLPPIDQFQLIEIVSGFSGATPEGKRALIARASDAENELDADFFARTFSLLAIYEETEKITFSDVLVVEGFPVGRTADNRAVIPLDVDLLAWSEAMASLTAQFDSRILASSGTTLYVSGNVTNLARKTLVAQGFDVHSNVIGGIYRSDWKP